MEKRKTYPNILFDQKILRSAVSTYQTVSLKNPSQKETYRKLSVNTNGEDWDYDDYEEYFAAYLLDPGWAVLRLLHNKASFDVCTREDKTIIAVGAQNRSAIEAVFSVFEQAVSNSDFKFVKKATKEPIIFIGHGRSPLWRGLKDHLTDQHGYSVQAYEVGARAGHTIRDILDDALDNSTFACLVMTGEDETENGTLRARQNVIHEVGLFQGRLGFSRAIVLLEDGTEPFSNIDGIQQIRFSKGNIREAYGDVLATLKREFG